MIRAPFGLKAAGKNPKTGKPYHYYICSRRRENSKACSTPYIRADKTDERLWFWLALQFIQNPKQFLEQYKPEIDRRKMESLEMDLEEVEKEIQTEEQEFTNLLSVHVGARLQEVVNKNKARIEKRLEALDVRKENITEELRLLKSQEDAGEIFDQGLQEIMENASTLGERFAEELTEEERREFIKVAFGKILYFPGEMQKVTTEIEDEEVGITTTISSEFKITDMLIGPAMVFLRKLLARKNGERGGDSV